MPGWWRLLTSQQLSAQGPPAFLSRCCRRRSLAPSFAVCLCVCVFVYCAVRRPSSIALALTFARHTHARCPPRPAPALSPIAPEPRRPPACPPTATPALPTARRLNIASTSLHQRIAAPHRTAPHSAAARSWQLAKPAALILPGPTVAPQPACVTAAGFALLTSCRCLSDPSHRHPGASDDTRTAALNTAADAHRTSRARAPTTALPPRPMPTPTPSRCPRPAAPPWPWSATPLCGARTTPLPRPPWAGSAV